MTRRVAVDVLRIDVGTVLDQCLYHAKISSKARYVQRCTEVIRSGIHLCAKLDQDLDERGVALARRQVERREAIGIGTINNFEHFVLLIEILLGEREDLHNLCPVALIDLGPVVHLDFFDVLFAIFLLLRFLAFARVAFD